MRISIPRVDYVPKLPPSLAVSVDEAADRLATFLEKGKGRAVGNEGAGTVILCGAGVSVDSGIRAYRGKGGSYNVNRTYRPIFFHEFVAEHYFRQRYWARSYLGYPPVQRAQANRTHFAIAALQHMGYLPRGIITQNVDRLQHKAIPSPKTAEDTIQELHGSLKHVHCLKCGISLDRDGVQKELSRLNPAWEEYLNDNIRRGTEPKTNPDGDVDLSGRSYSSFTPPPCPNESCKDGILKPSVIFFGENISKAGKARAEKTVQDSGQMLLLGTSLATYSAYRLLKQAHDGKKGVAMLNVGTSRGDDLVPDNMRFSLGSSDVLTRVALLLSNGREQRDSILDTLLKSGVLDPVIDKPAQNAEPGTADNSTFKHVVNPQ